MVVTTSIFSLNKKLKNENKEEFLTYSQFCAFEQIGKNILRKWLFQDALSNVHLNKFKFILQVILQVYSITAGWHKPEPWTNYPEKKWCSMRTSPFPQL